MKSKYEECCEIVKQRIKSINKIMLTSGPALPQWHIYVGVTCHFMKDYWEMPTINLASRPLHECPTAANIAEWMEELVYLLLIPPNKALAVVHAIV